jgi:diketogulonate reductase-like aldo/keto reductase
MKTAIPSLKLNNGVEMPQFGLGVFQVSEGQEVEFAVSKALELGYRSIDTAAGYKNEAGVGKAVKASGLKREEIFITTKLANSKQGYDSTLKAYEASLKELDCDYIDLYLIHWPTPMYNRYVESWKALEKLYSQKLVRAIGVSNFEPEHLDNILEQCEITPAVNQIEFHPYLTQSTLLDYCSKKGIIVEAWSPLMQGGEVLKQEIITSLAKKYNKTPAQIVLRWDIQKGVITIPKSVHENRIRENMDIFDFELSSEEMAGIDALNRDFRTGGHPNTFSLQF